MKRLLLAAGFLAGMIGIAFAGGLFEQFPSASHPLTGSETVPADTNLSGGRAPQTEKITVNQLKTYAVAPVALTPDQSVTSNGDVDIDLSLGNFFVVSLTTPATINTPTNAQNGQVWFLEAVQDSAGSRTLSWAALFEWPEVSSNNTAPTVTTTANSADIYQCHTLNDQHLCARIGYSYKP